MFTPAALDTFSAVESRREEGGDGEALAERDTEELSRPGSPREIMVLREGCSRRLEQQPYEDAGLVGERNEWPRYIL